MTYFSSGPVPVVSNSPTSSLTVPRGQNPNRRPSKLSPAERLYQPLQSLPPQPIPTVRHPSSPAPVGRPSLPASHTPSKGKDSTLPPLPEKGPSGQTELPGILKPGGASKPQAQGKASGSGPLPPILRPGNGSLPVSTPRPPDRQYHSPVSPSPSNPRSSRQPSPSFGTSTYNGSSAPNPYLPAPTPNHLMAPVIPPSGTATIPNTNYASYTDRIVPPAVPPSWHPTVTSSSNFSFPIPMLSAVPQPDLPQTEPYRSYGHNEQVVSEIPSSPPLDPYLAVRYQAPLPLPRSPIANHPNSAPSPPRNRQPELKPDPDRLEALKKAEGDSIQRREQEKRDLELALQLDQELNT